MLGDWLSINNQRRALTCVIPEWSRPLLGRWKRWAKRTAGVTSSRTVFQMKTKWRSRRLDVVLASNIFIRISRTADQINKSFRPNRRNTGAGRGARRRRRVPLELRSIRQEGKSQDETSTCEWKTHAREIQPSSIAPVTGTTPNKHLDFSA